uniref:HAT C-terminal dimerisation domain-containing protein n=1 Tax=Ditylenchus dipsaci TaxID=166011 RepID=A0A915DGU0_9BILA
MAIATSSISRFVLDALLEPLPDVVVDNDVSQFRAQHVKVLQAVHEASISEAVRQPVFSRSKTTRSRSRARYLPGQHVTIEDCEDPDRPDKKVHLDQVKRFYPVIEVAEARNPDHHLLEIPKCSQGRRPDRMCGRKRSPEKVDSRYSLRPLINRPARYNNLCVGQQNPDTSAVCPEEEQLEGSSSNRMSFSVQGSPSSQTSSGKKRNGGEMGMAIDFDPIYVMAAAFDPNTVQHLSKEQLELAINSVQPFVTWQAELQESNLITAEPMSELDLLLSEIADEQLKKRQKEEGTYSGAKSWLKSILTRGMAARASCATPIDPLKYWSNMLCTEYRSVAVLALKVLSVPATSAPIERVFSLAGLATRNQRNRTMIDLLNAQLIVYCNQLDENI